MEKDIEIYDTNISLEISFLRDEKLKLKEIKKQLEEILGVNIYLEDNHIWNFQPSKDEFKIESDFTGGKYLVKLTTGPMDYKTTRIKIQSILKWIRNTEEISTNERCILYPTIYYTKANYISNMNILKFILNFNEKEVYAKFPNRKDNVYAKSIKAISPLHGNYNFEGIVMNRVNFSYPNTKYYGVNFEKLAKNCLEFRYIGGEGYEKKQTDILELIDYFLISVKEAYIKGFNSKMQKELEKIVLSKKDLYLAGKSYFNFKNIFRKIDIMVDTKDNEEIIKSHFPKIWERLFPLLNSTINLKYTKSGIINYDTDSSILEFKDFYFNNSILDSAGCIFFDCKIENSVLNNEYLYYCSIKNTDIINCNTNYCNTKDSIFTDGEHYNDEVYNSIITGKNLYIQSSKIVGGVFIEGMHAGCNISKDTEILNAEEVETRENNN
jgi:hypothetical protein